MSRILKFLGVKNMKLYHINPNDYGQEFYICSESPETALNHIKKWLKDAAQVNNFYGGYLRLFENSNVDKLPLKYSIHEYQPNQVARSEVS